MASEVVVTAEIRFPLARVEEAYREALTPDGGVPEGVTFNAYLRQYAEGVAADMLGAMTEATYSTSWRLD